MTLNTDNFLQNRYRLEALLGQGGMGAVYRGVDLTFHSVVAIKENLATGVEAQKQFAHEASLLHKLRHPHIPRVTDYFFIPGRGQYLVMDYVEGESLAEILERHERVDEPQALAWIRQVLDALAYLHAQDVIHRDVKPANVKITSEGKVFLVDFGLAKVYDPSQRTTPGARAVTPGFAPPEQYGEGRTDARSDIYSAGATLYAMLTGQVLPDALTLMLGSERLTPPHELNPTVSERVEAAVLKAMQVRPDQRFQAVEAFRAALFAPGGAITTPVAPAEKLASPEPARKPFEPELVLVPAGHFLMGSDVSQDPNSKKHERPQHRLFLPAFYIARTPVTHAQYAVFVADTGHPLPNRGGWRDGRPPAGREDHPVVEVSGYDALAYCRWLSEVTERRYALPSEAQWEKAARGPDGRLYPWGDRWDGALANTGEADLGGTSPVAAHPQGASPYGVLDMAGNVYEWTRSLWSKTGERPRLGYGVTSTYPQGGAKLYSYPYRPDDGREDVDADDQTPRVVRGGSFIHRRYAARCAHRDWSLPNAKYVSHGFRVMALVD